MGDEAPALDRGTAVTGLVLAVLAFSQVGSIFIPVMDEGTPVITLRKHPTIGVEAAADMDLRMQRQIMAAVPEVKRIMARAGADELGIDPVGLNESDMFLTIAPQEEWRPEFRAGGMPALMDAIRVVMESVPASPSPSTSRSTCACRR
jgi:cobalt-zinc-cadmium resistance protein CzcA